MASKIVFFSLLDGYVFPVVKAGSTDPSTFYKVHELSEQQFPSVVKVGSCDPSTFGKSSRTFITTTLIWFSLQSIKNAHGDHRHDDTHHYQCPTGDLTIIVTTMHFMIMGTMIMIIITTMHWSA